MCRRQMFLGQVSDAMGPGLIVVRHRWCIVLLHLVVCISLYQLYLKNKLDNIWLCLHACRQNPCSPLTSCAPASVKSMLITSSKLHPGSKAWLSWPTWCNILFRTSSRDAAVSSSKMLALARKPSRSRCARTSSSKFISFTYCGKTIIISSLK